MEAIEIAVYFIVAAMAGGLLIFAIQQTDYQKEYGKWRDAIRNESDLPYYVSKGEFADALAKRWQACRYGMDNVTSSLYVNDAGTFSEDEIRSEVVAKDHCDVIDCANKSDGFLVLGGVSVPGGANYFEIPKVINIRCFNGTLIIEE